mmetsp:Transcript_12427/g.31381  ORF Transcript_12427/g.31381 Transcript_12427/m.31381 type:complete len:161 (-) Transcript_12427:31-513(-)
MLKSTLSDMPQEACANIASIPKTVRPPVKNPRGEAYTRMNAVLDRIDGGSPEDRPVQAKDTEAQNANTESAKLKAMRHINSAMVHMNRQITENWKELNAVNRALDNKRCRWLKKIQRTLEESWINCAGDDSLSEKSNEDDPEVRTDAASAAVSSVWNPYE